MTQMYKTETNAVLRFFEEAPKNNFLSEQEGKPIFDTALMCEVITPGQAASTLTLELERTLNSVAGLDEDGKRKVKRTGHFKRFEAQVKAYRTDSGEFIDDGTPIGSWAQIDKGTAETLKSQGIFTVEALASVSDGSLGNLGTGARTMRDQAASFLTSRQFGLPDAQNSAALSKATSEIAELKEQLTELRNLLDKQSADSSPENEEKPVAAVV